MKKRYVSFCLTLLLAAAILVSDMIPTGKVLAAPTNPYESWSPTTNKDSFDKILPDYQFLTSIDCEGDDFISLQKLIDVKPGQVTVLIFGSTTCSNTKGELTGIGRSAWVKDPSIRVIFFETTGASLGATKNFAKSCRITDTSADSGVVFCYGAKLNPLMNDCLDLFPYEKTKGSIPFTFFIDEKNQARDVMTGLQSADAIKKKIDEIRLASTPTPTPTPTNTPEPTPTTTPMPTPTEKPAESTPEPTPTNTPVPTPTEKPAESTPEPTPTNTPVPTPTEKPAESTPEPTPTNTPVPTPTEKPAESTPEPTPTSTPIPTPTNTPVPTPTNTPVPTPTVSPTPTATPTPRPTSAPTPRPTTIPRPTSTPIPTSTPTPTPTPSPTPTPVPPVNMSVQGTEEYGYVAEVLELVNQTRAKKGLPALSLDAELTETAMQRAAEISVYYSHTRPDGSSCFSATNRGTYRAENIAVGYASPKAVMAAWNSSAGHYANIMSGMATSIGIGCFRDSKGVLNWVQFFDNDPAVEPIKTGSIQVTRAVSTGVSNIKLRTNGWQILTCSQQGKSVSMKVYNVNAGFNASNPEIASTEFVYTSSNPAVATVNSEGVVTINGFGTAAITASLKENPSISVTQEFTLINHVYNDKTIDPTPTTSGYTLHTCVVCRHSYQDTYLPALADTDAEHTSK